MKKSVTLAIALSVGIATATTALQINGETIVPEPFSYGDDYYTPEEHYCMALNIYHEARAEHLAGQVAVADVTLNRVKETIYVMLYMKHRLIQQRTEEHSLVDISVSSLGIVTV